MEHTLARCLQLPASIGYETNDQLALLVVQEQRQFDAAMQLPFDIFDSSSRDELRLRFEGKKSPIQEWLKSLRVLPADLRKSAGAVINELKKHIEVQLSPYLKKCLNHAEELLLQSERCDLTLPLPLLPQGSRHPVSVVTRELLAPLQRMGFAVMDGPEIETEFHNFDALNILRDHPAREMQDTFFLASEWVLRTQTSSVQVHAMTSRPLPLRVVCPGYVYRKELDMTHVPTFRQFECLVVDKGIHWGHLRGTLDSFFKEVFGRPVEMRLRSSYFPFTEPSAEIDVQCQQCVGKGCRSCKNTGWLEMGGCGMINPKVLLNCKIDPNVYSGFAFGMGLDRIAMSKYAISDLRALFDGQVSFLKEFRLS